MRIAIALAFVLLAGPVAASDLDVLLATSAPRSLVQPIGTVVILPGTPGQIVGYGTAPGRLIVRWESGLLFPTTFTSSPSPVVVDVLDATVTPALLQWGTVQTICATGPATGQAICPASAQAPEFACTGRGGIDCYRTDLRSSTKGDLP